VTGSRPASGATSSPRKRLEELVDAPRPGAARTISDEVVGAVVVETLGTTPKDATHWPARSMAQRHGISRQTVSEIWRAFELKPWRQDEFKISPDPDPDREDPRPGRPVPVPPVAAAVYAVDEKPGIVIDNITGSATFSNTRSRAPRPAVSNPATTFTIVGGPGNSGF
jgi:hypothetical protein